MRTEKLETTLGDLIVALTEETGRQLGDERATYELVAYIVNDLIDDSNRRSATAVTH